MTVPRRAYLAALLKIRRQIVWGSFALVTTIVLFGGVVLRAVSVAHTVILREAALMNDFVLAPSKNSCRFYDINRVLSSLERAKTAMRSMGKYVPMDLVRRLYKRDEEPRLGGEATQISALFTDIRGFTAFAEAADTDTVANCLGEYLQVMVSVIQGEKGTIDKFIGDSVMAFWNAPELVPDNAALACRAIVGCREGLARLYASPKWEGIPGFGTRFGLHHCVASVGHFGSPERFNYTAIGDGINLASRLERLNKYYGTSAIVSAAVRDSAGPGFHFRHLDCVAVKGKTQSLDIYELIGDSAGPIPPYVAGYEQALAAWLEGDFQRALALAEAQPDDPPSVFLAGRCRAFVASPPADWKGVFAFDAK
jgi:adenylate cyclase